MGLGKQTKIKIQMGLNKKIKSIPKYELEFYLKHGAKINSINGFVAKPLLKYSFKIVKYDLPELLQKGDFIGVAKLLLDGKIGILNVNILLNFVLWVFGQIENINNIEKKFLTTTPEADLVNAGINDLDIFGYQNVVDNLAGGDILKYNDILNISYENILDKLIRNNIESRIQKNYQKIISKKK
jgi:hypothetical protein